MGKEMVFMRIRYAIFDMDGLLFDSERVYLQGYAELAPKYGMEPDRELFLKTVGTAYEKSKEIFLEVYPGLDYDAMREDLRVYMRHAMESALIPLKPGVHSILSGLRNNGVKVALATSTRRPLTTFMLKAADIADYFNATVCGDEVAMAKPNPEIFLKAMRMLGGTPETTMIFEDSHNGIRAANAAGIPVIMVPDLLEPLDALKTFAVAKDLNEALRLILPMIRDDDDRQ